MLRASAMCALRRRAAMAATPRFAVCISASSHASIYNRPVATLRFCSTGTVTRSRATDDAAAPQEPPTSASSSSPAAASASAKVALEGDAAHQPGEHLGAGGKYDPWEVMGLKAGASAHDIRLRYNDLTKLYHPSYATAADADLAKWVEIDRAYQLLTKAPTIDSKYRAHVSEAQSYVYRVLPEWMARNVDDKPRWVTWLRYRIGDRMIFLYFLILCYVGGRLSVSYPLALPLTLIAVIADFLLHTWATPTVLLYCVAAAALDRKTGPTSISWLMSPKHFLQQDLTY